MKEIKTCKNVEFDVIYDDGTRRRVHEGVLFEVEDEKMRGHIGTSRPEVLFATAEAIGEMIAELGMVEAFMRYFLQGLKIKEKEGSDNVSTEDHHRESDRDRLVH